MTTKEIEVTIEIRYEPTYVGCVPHYTNSKRNFFVSEEKYNKLLEILED